MTDVERPAPSTPAPAPCAADLRAATWPRLCAADLLLALLLSVATGPAGLAGWAAGLLLADLLAAVSERRGCPGGVLDAGSVLLRGLAWGTLIATAWPAGGPALAFTAAAAGLAAIALLGLRYTRVQPAIDAEREARALQRSEQQLREAEQLAGLGSFDWNPVSGDLHWSDQHYKLWGLETGSVTPSYEVFLSRIPADDRATVEQRLRVALSGGERYDCEHRVQWPDGTVRHVHGRGEVHFDDQGQAVRMVGSVLDITERLRTEASLRLSDFVVNAITDPVGVVDSDLRYRLVNAAWQRANERSAAEAIGRPVDEVFPVVLVPERRQAMVEAIGGAEARVARGPAPGASQRARILETRYFPFRDPALGWRGAVMISRDITEAEHARDALDRSVQNLRLTLNTIGDAVFATDAHGQDDPVLFANQQLLALWRIPPERADPLTAATIIEFARPLFVDPVREVARILEIIASGQPAEDRLVLNDGRVLVRRCMPTREEGRMVRVWGFRDVTAEARALAALRDAEARQRALLDAFPGYIAVVDERGRYAYANPRAAALLGHAEAASLIGRDLREVLPAHRIESALGLLQRVTEGRPETEEFRYPGQAGQPPTHLLTTVVRSHGPAGQPQYYAFGIDISALKRAEEALIAARDDAERANRAKTQFLSSMSHELRTPLNAVLGFSQLLLQNADHNLAAEQLHQIGEIQRGGDHLLRLINDLLDLARVESGHMNVVAEPVALEALFAECLTLMQPVADRLGRRLLAQPPRPGTPGVVADPMRLKQVLLNLLSNAVKYNRPQGEVRLGCVAAGAQWRIEVRDQGPGIEPAAQARLFQAFERLDADRTDTEGTGIGLALSRQLVWAMGGEIGVESRPGHGSCFWVRLPAARGERVQPAAPKAGSTPATGPAGSTPPAGEAAALAATLLYIDDNPVNLALMQGLLRKRRGLRLLTTQRPREGLTIAARERPDLVLVDLQMPVLDGMAVFDALRAEPATARIPVVAVSANAMSDSIERCRAAGFADYVTKPIDARRVFEVIERLVG